ncbi:MAG: toll/interleukin-1 receptor domain-containing protein, partial [Proteobacteria bacterium]|nr:toll/interleukin-1 receptor domain-containing protein [Pseudomonadota bacterium]
MPILFVSHASEDKKEFVRPLAHALKAHGLQVWYDEFSLRPGDSLRTSIDKGLRECDAGVLVLSPSFFEKQWPQRELDALFGLEIAGRTTLIPVWHRLGASEVLTASPLLADRVALQSSKGVNVIASEIAKQFQVEASIKSAKLAEIIQRYQHTGFYEGEMLFHACQERFLRMNAFKEDFHNFLFSDDIQEHFDEDLGDFPPEISEKLGEAQERLRGKYEIPRDVYLTIDEPVREKGLAWWIDSLCGWVSGTLERSESAELISELDLQELDEYFILLGVPNFAISGEQRDLLEDALIEMGCGLENEFRELEPICEA